jgi:glycogen debranching enzyme
MSYHNGSVWPHDNALIAAGLARYGMTDLAARLLTAFFDVSLLVDLRRMPELFCGFSRRAGEGPTRYPVACQPQAWAAGAATLMLQSTLGLTIDAPNHRVTFDKAVLPPGLDRITIEHLVIGDAALDLVAHRYAHDVGVGAMGRHEGVEVVVIK